MYDNLPSHHDIDKIQFRVYSDADIDKISVMRVVSDEALNKLGHCNKGGLYDLRMGPIEKVTEENCHTCRQRPDRCIGHCGHIDLPLPVFNPFFTDRVLKLLKMTCLACGRLQTDELQVVLLKYQLQLLALGFSYQALEAANILTQDDEAIQFEDGILEVRVTVEDQEVVNAENNNIALSKVEKTMQRLKNFYNSVVKDGAAEHHKQLQQKQEHNHKNLEIVVTSTVRTIRDDIVKLFLSKIKVNQCCKHCLSPMFTVMHRRGQMFVDVKSIQLQNQFKKSGFSTEGKESQFTIDPTKQSLYTPLQARDLLRLTWASDEQTLLQMFPMLKWCTASFTVATDAFFITKLLVIPPKYRPIRKLHDKMLEHESCVLLKGILRLCRCMIFLAELIKNPTMTMTPEVQLILGEIRGATNHQKVDKVWELLQGSVNNMLDARAHQETKQTEKGIKQIFEKKEGLFRSNLMGKRVNFSARSVIAPDPALAVDEVGVPRDFAMHLHYPVPVTPWNVAYLRKLVINGPDNYPGAVMIELEDGSVVHLRITSEQERIALAKKLLTPCEKSAHIRSPWKIVYRQLADGDLVLMNRQPTLHRPSIQAHKCKIMNGRVLRMPYANCKAYNADFDGDEMNLHFPQNELCRSEAQYLVTTHNQYLTPKDGSPLSGLVQDCVVAGVTLTMRGNMFNKEDYMQMVNVALQDHHGPVKILQPAIIKPKMLWSGKQVFSTILLNLIPHQKALPTFNFKTSVKVDVWQTTEPKPPRDGEWQPRTWPNMKTETMTESEFIMRDGELVCGVVDKNAIGSKSYGLIHVCYDLYGGTVASELLTAFNRLCMYYLQIHGHTISSKEFLTPQAVAATRRRDLANLIKATPSLVLDKLEMDAPQFRKFWEGNHLRNCQKNVALVDAAFTQVLGHTTSTITTNNERGLFRRTLDNSMRLMVDSGAKGSKVNMNQMASLFGSTALDGMRMPISVAGKSLPSFQAYDMNPRAGGYISTRFMTGMDPQSYLFLCIVGRDSLQHTAVKTANSGYMQRCLIKHLEGISVQYDMTVRNSDGLVLQFEYGEDGLDVMKVPFLRSSASLDVVVDNCVRLHDPAVVERVRSRGDPEALASRKKKVHKWLKKNSARSKDDRRSGFLQFCAATEAAGRLGDLDGHEIIRQCGRPKKAVLLQKMWRELKASERDHYQKKACTAAPAPLLAQFSGQDVLGALSEVMDDLIDDYYTNSYSTRPHQHKLYDKKQVETVVAMKALRAKVEPGEAVGAICAQAIGEPLTQMTLNTFHFAGRDELNVTLGVPRMVEILRTASANISTPIMEVPFLPHVTRASAEALRRKFTEVTLKQVLHELKVTTVEAEFSAATISSGGRVQSKQRVTLRFSLLPSSHYKQEFPVTCTDVLRFIECTYILKGIIKPLTTKKAVSDICASLKARGPGEESGGGSGGDGGGAGFEDVADEPQATNDDAMLDTGEEAQSDVGEDDDKTRQNKKNEQDYDDDEEEEDDDEDDDNDSDHKGTKRPSRGDKRGTKVEDMELSDDEGFEEEQNIEGVVLRGRQRQKQATVPPDVEAKRVAAVLNLHPWITGYSFDTHKEQWCELTLSIANNNQKYDFKSVVAASAPRAFVHRFEGIKQAFVDDKDDKLMLRTEGVNIYKMVEYAHLIDVRRLYTNDIQLVARTFGIEAAQRSIIREIRAVQQAYNIEVDFRHLTLLAEYFTCEGRYSACNRGGLKSCQSTVQQMSYESTLGFLKSALLEDVPDRMQSPSARVATGQVVNLGTNLMDILTMPSIASAQKHCNSTQKTGRK